MDVLHRITLDDQQLTPQDRDQLEEHGVSSWEVRRRTVFLTVRDDDPNWPQLRELVQRTGGRDLPVRTFTNGERNVARWLAITPVSHHGWPGTKPIRDSLNSLFAVPGTTICPDCESTRGTRGSSDSLLYFAGEPSWQKTDFLQIDGFRDLWFTRPEIYHDVFEPLGVRSRPVLHRFKRTPLRTVVELIPTMENVSLQLPEEPQWETVRCPTCGVSRLDVGKWGGWVPEQGVLPPIEGMVPESVHFLTTRQGFTATTVPEGYTWRLCLISQTLFRAIRFRHLRGIASEPIGWEE